MPKKDRKISGKRKEKREEKERKKRGKREGKERKKASKKKKKKREEKEEGRSQLHDLALVGHLYKGRLPWNPPLFVLGTVVCIDAWLGKVL